MLQILGLGDHGHIHFEKQMQAPDMRALLHSPTSFMQELAEDERVNIYFTVHDCKGETARDFTFQEILPFDIDNIKEDDAERVAKVVCDELGVNFAQTGVIFSGHGVQLFVQLRQRITNPNYFREYRELYKSVCQRIQIALKESGLKGDVDTSVFSPKRLMRMPETWNRKPHKGADKWARVIQPTIEEQGFSLETACGVPILGSMDSVHKESWKKFPAADTQGVLDGCDFIKWAKARQGDVTEPQWYALCGLIGFLEDGDNLIHEYSKGHPHYSFEETDFKVKQAKSVSGPRTCKSIETLWDGCHTCANFGKCITPLQIKSDDFIATESTGFYHTVVLENGQRKLNPAYTDLVKYYRREQGQFFACSETEGFYVYNAEKKHWETFGHLHLESYAFHHFAPEPRSNIVNEFVNTAMRFAVRDSRWMDGSRARKLNLLNGVFDIEKDELLEHTPDYGFLGILPYAYDAKAEAPEFTKFIKKIMCEREDLVEFLIEFLGYAISGDQCWIHKALILIGEGSNGKSTLTKLIAKLIGDDNCGKLNVKHLGNLQNIALLEGKLVNISDESEPEDMLTSDMFKTLVSGGSFLAKEVYKKPVQRTNTAKFIISANEYPKIKDKSHGMFRRLAFVPFDARFSHDIGNIDVDIDAKLERELPGILNILIAGYRRVLKRGRIIEPTATRNILEEFSENVDEFSRWYEQNINLADEREFVAFSDLYSDYMQFCEAEYVKYPVSQMAFSYKLTNKTKHIQKARRRHAGRSVRGFSGITLARNF